jgi:hypothetical protein
MLLHHFVLIFFSRVQCWRRGGLVARVNDESDAEMAFALACAMCFRD